MSLLSPKKNKVTKTSLRYQITLLSITIVGLLTGYGLGCDLKAYWPETKDTQPQNDYQNIIEEFRTQQDRNQQSLYFQTLLPSNAEQLETDDLQISNEVSLKKNSIFVRNFSIANKSSQFPKVQQKKRETEQASPSKHNTPLPVTSAPPISTKNWKKYAVPAKPDGRPMVAIVFDDLGIDRSRTLRAIKIPGPLTMSFLTYADQLKEQTEAARSAGHEIWMHVPMEPSKATIDPGPKVLLTGSDPTELIKNLTWSLNRFDKYVGINNHMGSRFTANLAEMHVVMAELKRRGLAFLDSVTSRQSQARLAASTTGVDFATRNIFIDHQNDLTIIRQQLSKIENLARKQGYAIAIGHPRDKTLEAIKPWLKTLNYKGLMLVPVSTLLNRSQLDGHK